MKNVLVTGGVGFIGSHLSEKLLANGWDLVIADNFNNYYNPEFKCENRSSIEYTAKKYGRACKIYKIDIYDQDELEKVFAEQPIELVIHLAACAGVRPSIENPKLYSEVNIGGTLNILECMKKYNVKKLLFASSSSVYGNNKEVPFNENASVDCPISPYAATKKSGELLCYTYHHLYDINVACLRFFTVYGPRQRPDLAIYKFTEMIFNGQPIPFYGDGTMQRDYTYIEDTLDGIIKAMKWVSSDEKRYEIFNLGESQTISLTQMVQMIEKGSGKKAAIDRKPPPPGDVRRTFADIEKAKAVLGYSPKTHFEEGIQNFIEWFQMKRL